MRAPSRRPASRRCRNTRAEWRGGGGGGRGGKGAARGVAGQSVRKMRQKGFDLVVGSSGTITNLAAATARRLGDAPAMMRNYTVSVDDLRATVAHLCELPLAERRNVAGLDTGRADIV